MHMRLDALHMAAQNGTGGLCQGSGQILYVAFVSPQRSGRADRLAAAAVRAESVVDVRTFLDAEGPGCSSLRAAAAARARETPVDAAIKMNLHADRRCQ
jgi:hypothetical protein